MSANGGALGAGRTVTVSYWCDVCQKWTKHVGQEPGDGHDGGGPPWVFTCQVCEGQDRRAVGVGLDLHSRCERCAFRAYLDAGHRPLYGVLPDQVTCALYWLVGVLGPAPVPLWWVTTYAPLSGLHWRTLESAKARLGVVSKRVGGEMMWFAPWHDQGGRGPGGCGVVSRALGWLRRAFRGE